MDKRKPVTKTMKASEARQQFSQVINQVFRREARVIVEKSGIPVAAIISAEDLERLNRLEEQRAEHFKALDATRDAFKDVPDEELEREVAKAVQAAREELRKKAEHEKDFSILDKVGEAFKDIPVEELEREVDRAVKAAREELRKERQAQDSM